MGSIGTTTNNVELFYSNLEHTIYKCENVTGWKKSKFSIQPSLFGYTGFLLETNLNVKILILGDRSKRVGKVTNNLFPVTRIYFLD